MIQNQSTVQRKKVKRYKNKLWPIYSNLAEKLHADLGGRHKPFSMACAGFAKSEGSSTVAANLAIAFSMIFDQEVLLVNATDQPSGFGSLLGVDPKVGIEQLVNEDAEISDVISSTSISKLDFMGNGLKPRHSFSPHLLARFPDVLDALKSKYQTIVVDLPSLDRPSTSGPLSNRVDGLLLVMQPAKVKSEVAKRVKHQLDRSNVNLLGVVMNRCE